MFKKGWEIAIRVWDLHLQPEWLGKPVLGLGFGAGLLTSGATFWAALLQGITPLYAIFLALFALLLTVLIALGIMEATRKRSPKHVHSATIQLSGIKAKASTVKVGTKRKGDGTLHARPRLGKPSYVSDKREYIPLPEAAHRVLTAMQTRLLGIKALKEPITEQGLNYVGVHISCVKGMRLFGQRPPLDVIEEVEHLGRYRMEGAKELYLPGANGPTYIALSVLSSELDSNWEKLIAGN
jgi:hypothetical protein